jgi:hypothetical protein
MAGQKPAGPPLPRPWNQTPPAVVNKKATAMWWLWAKFVVKGGGGLSNPPAFAELAPSTSPGDPGRNRTCIKSLGNFYSIH